MPLWAKLAPVDRAEKVKDNMMDEGKFNLRVPMPTASFDNDKFEAARYWRGPVWLDQALYGVEALQNYGYEDEATALAYKLFDGAEGVLTDEAIHENQMCIRDRSLGEDNRYEISFLIKISDFSITEKFYKSLLKKEEKF